MEQVGGADASNHFRTRKAYEEDGALLSDGILEQFVVSNSLSSPLELPLGTRSQGVNDIDRVLLSSPLGSPSDDDYYDSIGEMEKKEPEEAKLIRRLEMCARAREESTKIMSLRYAQRNNVREEYLREQRQFEKTENRVRRERYDRWSSKTQKSPFNIDLVAEHQRLDEESRMRDQLEQRKNKLASKRDRDAHNAIFKRAIQTQDELDLLRKEKRELLENEKRLKAMRDLEKSNARTELVLQQRRQRHLELVKLRSEKASSMNYDKDYKQAYI